MQSPSLPSARERILDAFVDVLVSGSARSATLEAVAAAAGVSKGGLLYHFPSKDALSAGLAERLDAFMAEDIAAIHASPSGAIDYYIRTSIESGSPFDRTFVALARLTQDGDAHARAAIGRARQAWFEAMLEHVGDPVTARIVCLVGDGLYYDSLQRPAAASADGVPLDELIASLQALVERSGR